MDSLDALIKRISDHLAILHGQMELTAWEEFQRALIRLQPILDDRGNEKLRIKAFYELYETCLQYEPVRRQLPHDPTMLAGPPQPRKKSEPVTGLPEQPTRQRVSDIIERMKELGSAKPSQPGSTKQTGDRE
jgi:hypothetical protein